MKRRRAADLTRADVALKLAPAPSHRARLADWLGQLERDEVHTTDAILTALRGFFAFDVEVYRQLLDIHLGGELAADMLPHPRVCRVCACSFHDACETDDGPCAWKAADDDICTACDDDNDGEPEEAPPPAIANDIDAKAAA